VKSRLGQKPTAEPTPSSTKPKQSVRENTRARAARVGPRFEVDVEGENWQLVRRSIEQKLKHPKVRTVKRTRD